VKNKRFLILAFILCAAIIVVIGLLNPSSPARSSEQEGELSSESWDALPSPFEGITQFGVRNVPEHDVILEASMPSVPKELMVYRVLKPDVDEKFASRIADNFGFNGELVPTKSGEPRMAYVFTNDTHILEVELDGSIRLYRKNLPESGELPTEEECITIAENWLRSHGIYSADLKLAGVGISLIRNGKPAAVGVRFMRSIDGIPIRNAIAYVSVTYDGLIQEVMLTIYDAKPYAAFKLKTPDTALKILKAYLDSGGITPEGQPRECIANYILFKRLIVRNVTLEYFLGKEYVQPVYVFQGEADGEEFTGIVDAINRSGS